MDTFYDVYVSLLRETVDILQDPDKQRAIARAQGIDSIREMLEINPAYLYTLRGTPRGVQHLQAQLRQCNPYVFEPPVAQLLLDMGERAGETPLPYEPFLKLPLWIEFEGVGIGDEQMFVAAIFCYRDFLSDAIRCDLLAAPDMQRTKTILFAPEGKWEYEQMGACSARDCRIAAKTKDGFPYRLREIDEFLVAEVAQCTCARAGYTWAQIIKAANHLLKHRKEPFVETLTVRECTTPHEHAKTRKEKEQNSAARKKSRRNVVTLSLSAPVSVSVRSPGNNQGARSSTSEREKISVEGYWKILIPGEGKPWKALRIVQVESYQRAQKPSETRTIYRVEE